MSLLRELGLVPVPLPNRPHSLPAPPRASPCSSSASTSWSSCWTMPRCHGASRYLAGGTGDSEEPYPTLAWGLFPHNASPPLPAGCVPGPGLLLHLRFLWSCPAGHPHLVSFRRALVSPALSPKPSHPVLLLNTPRSYLMLSSVVGFYSSPLFTRLLPERQDTPVTKVRVLGWDWGGSQPPLGGAGPHSAWLRVSLRTVPTQGQHVSCPPPPPPPASGAALGAGRVPVGV